MDRRADCRRHSFRIAPRLGRVLLLALLLGALPLVARAAVDLVSFEATPDDDAILVTWETASEVDMAGFFVQRAAQIDGTYARVSPIIPAEGGMTGHAYEYVDEDVAPGDTVYYQLEALEVTGFIQLFGPISATLALPPTATPTPSPTPAPPIYNPGGASPLPTSTPAPPTATPRPPTVTPTPTPRPTQTSRTPTWTPTPRPATASPSPVFSFRSPTPARTRTPSPTPPAAAGSSPSGTPSPTPTLTLTPLLVPTLTPSLSAPDPLQLAEAGEPQPTTIPPDLAVKDGGVGLPLWMIVPGIGLALLGLVLVAGLLRWFLRRRL